VRPGAPFDEAGLSARIVERAAACSVELDARATRAIARHMLRVMEADPELHLTAIEDAPAFLERHVGESLEGASMLDASIRGVLLDIGSGNGYPGLPVAACRPGLRPVLAEASRRKAEFLRGLLFPDFPDGVVLERQVQRAQDLASSALGEIAVVTCRGMGNWERVLPRLATSLRQDSRVLVWAGERMDDVMGRVVWRRLRLRERRSLPGRERSWVWCFEKVINL